MVPDALRGFPATPAFVIQAAPPFRGFVPSSRPSQADIVEAAWHVRKHLGISSDAWGEACLSMGRWPAAVAVAAIAARHEAGQVRSPGGLLRKMVELNDRGELRLDRTLYGLADRLEGVSRPEKRGSRPRPS
jgi:replication initiation protein RepC